MGTDMNFGNKMPYNVPEGYFEGLRAMIVEIPDREHRYYEIFAESLHNNCNLSLVFMSGIIIFDMIQSCA